jgi:cystathionine beta-lyase
LLGYIKGNFDYLHGFFEKEIPQISVVKPEGTYLVWLDCRKLGLDVEELSEFMVEKAKVALDDGYWFGTGGEGFERINIACPRAHVEEALKRMKNAVDAL